MKKLIKKYVIFKDDDIGKDFINLKKWIKIIIDNDAKASIGLIGKYLNNKDLRDYLNLLDSNKIEIFCHGYYHSYIPFLMKKYLGNKSFFKAEFEKSKSKHDSSFKKYRKIESLYLKNKAITFGPPGNNWNEFVIESLIDYDFKLMFSWKKISKGILTVPLVDNLKQNSFDGFIKDYSKNKNKIIYTLQFHHANLSEKQFDIIPDIINFLKKDEKREFILPRKLLEISKKDKGILKEISLKN